MGQSVLVDEGLLTPELKKVNESASGEVINPWKPFAKFYVNGQLKG